jgi:hypothetical protein
MLDLIPRFVHQVSRSLKVVLWLHKSSQSCFVADDSLARDGSVSFPSRDRHLRTGLAHDSKGRSTNSSRIFLASTSEQGMP